MEKSKNNMPIKWLKFLIFWRIPIGLVFNAINTKSLIAVTDYDSIIAVTHLIIFALVTLVLPLVVFVYSSKYKKQGYYLLKTLLVIEVLYNSAINALNTINPYSNNILYDFLYVYAPLVTILLVIWLYPNFVYLKNRKSLFSLGNKAKNIETKHIENTYKKRKHVAKH